MHAWDENTKNDALDARITQALEAAPPIVVPEDFARRVMEQLPKQRWNPAMRRFHYGPNAAIASMVLLTLAMVGFVIAQPNSRFLSLGLVPLLAAQLGGLIFWLSTRRQSWR